VSVERAEALALDAADPLASFRDAFVITDPQRIYADGNSLGRLPRAVAAVITDAMHEWGDRIVEAWDGWIDLPTRVGDRLAAVCLGAQPDEVVACDSTTVNLYKLVHAACDLREGAIVTDRANFPTDRYVLEGLAGSRGRRLVLADSVADALAVPDAAVVCLSHVDYRSGEALDMAALTRTTEALVVWDLSHSVGAIEIDCSTIDLAVGCSYKYLNAGPGGPAFLFVRRALADAMRSPIQGWFGQHEQFAMGPRYDPLPGAARFLAGSPPVLGLLALDASLDLLADAGMPQIARKGRALTSLAATLADDWLAPLGFTLATPRDPAARGSHVALRHADAWPICRALIERANVVPDFRRPDIVRLGFPPLYTRFADVWDAMDRLRGLVAAGEHHHVDPRARRVT
jgi:kynureninase